MTCSSTVKECRQSCIGGICVVQCDAEKSSLDCSGGICTKIKSASTSEPSTPSHTTKETVYKDTPTGAAMKIPNSFVWALMLYWLF